MVVKMDSCMSKSGFTNEKEIIEKLNRKKFRDLNENLKKLISYSFNNYEGVITATPLGGQNKSDMIVSIGKEYHSYSIKIGSGNSIHQEPLEVFIDYLEDNFGVSDNIKNYIRFFIWGDNTFDGSGKVSDRLSAGSLKKSYPSMISEIQDFFDMHKEDLIKRFLVTGIVSNSLAEFIYYGSYQEGIVAKSSNVLKYISKGKSRGAISVGKLTFQAWNRNINGGDKSEMKRGVIQLKWPTIVEDLKESRNE